MYKFVISFTNFKTSYESIYYFHMKGQAYFPNFHTLLPILPPFITIPIISSNKPV
ncbi:hypothetical protein Hanom_Chr07g00644731 [Helianthus anomalus]